MAFCRFRTRFALPMAVILAVIGCAPAGTVPRSASSPVATLKPGPAPTPVPSADLSASADGNYVCRAEQGFGNDCTQPLVATPRDWQLGVAGTRLRIVSEGFDKPEISCSGSWTGQKFVCRPTWTRAGRTCNLAMQLEREDAGSLSFWIGNADGERATCWRQAK